MTDDNTSAENAVAMIDHAFDHDITLSSALEDQILFEQLWINV